MVGGEAICTNDNGEEEEGSESAGHNAYLRRTY